MRKKYFSNEIHGFTLLEMSMVVAIIGIILTVAIPNLQIAKRHNALKSEATAIISEIKYIQQIAVDEGVSYRLYFDEKNKRAIVRKDTDMTDIKIHIFDYGVNFDTSSSSGLVVAGSEEYLEVIGEKGIINGSVETIVALKDPDGTLIYVRIFQGRKIGMTWE